MAGFIKIKDITQAGKARSAEISAESLINLYYEKNDEEAKNEGNSVYGTPGLDLFLDMAFDTPIYASHYFLGLLYVVTNNSLYTVNASGTKVLLGSVGTINQNVQLEDNGLVVILLTPSGAGYLATATTFNQITDPFFNSVAAGSFCVLATYAIFSIQGTNQFFWSEPNDAATYNALNVATAEQSPGVIVRMFRNNADLWIYKEDIAEIWQLTGQANLPFTPATGLTFQQGSGAKLSTDHIKGAILWLGNDKSVYQTTGYTFGKVSSVDIDNQLTKLQIISDAISFTYSQAGHWFYVLTFPSEGVTVVFDLTTKKWHIRRSYELDRWKANCFAFAFGLNLVCDFQTSKIYILNLDTYTEDGNIIERIAITPPLFNDSNRFFVYAVELDMKSGVGTLSGQGQNPVALMQVSDDENNTYSMPISQPIGQMGQYKTTIRWSQIGYSYNMSFKFTITDPIEVAISGIYAIIKTGVK